MPLKPGVEHLTPEMLGGNKVSFCTKGKLPGNAVKRLVYGRSVS